MKVPLKEFFCILEVPKPPRVRHYLRITKLKGINFDWQMATENSILLCTVTTIEYE